MSNAFLSAGNVFLIGGAVEHFVYKEGWKRSAKTAGAIAIAQFLADYFGSYILSLLPASVVGTLGSILTNAVVVGIIYSVINKYYFKLERGTMTTNFFIGAVISYAATMVDLLEISGIKGAIEPVSTSLPSSAPQQLASPGNNGATTG